MSDAVTRLNAALEGRYAIERELGEGGMATVYLAEDLKHERKVALKVLKPELAAVVGAERFLAEIKTTANLQHPHILPLFDSGEADTYLFYVMPYVEGETLRDRLDRDHQLPVDEAVRIATAVANALDYAHRQGVIHRDIKPGNVLIHDGQPVISDFGIALAVGVAGGGRLTETGLSLGTPHYMSPEQATGDISVGATTDIYALGCVLYETLVGEPPYTGSTAQAILGKIVTGDADPVTTHRKSVPVNVDAAIRKALEKVPADRFASAQGFAKALGDPDFSHGEAQVAGRVVGLWNRLSFAMTTVAVAATAVAVWGWLERPSDPLREALWLALDLGETMPDVSSDVVVSPDRSAFAFASEEPDQALWVRHASEATFRRLPGTENARHPAFSPDGGSIVYATQNSLLKISLSGGAAQTVLPSGIVPGPGTPFWGDDDTIVFRGNDGLYRIAAAGGGQPQLLMESPGSWVWYPRLLPGGKGVLLTDGRTRSVALFDLEADTLRVLISEGVDATYVNTGHLIYAHPAGGLFAARFDLRKMELQGDPVPVLDNVSLLDLGSRPQNAPYAVAQDGTLVYGAGDYGGRTRAQRLLLVDLNGVEQVLDLAPRVIGEVAWAPNGRSIVYSSGADIFTYDVELGTTPRPLTSEGANVRPVFAPDGSRVAFSSLRADTDDRDLFVKTLDDDAPATLLVRLPGAQYPTQWPADTLIVFESGPGGTSDLWMLDLSDADDPRASPYLPLESDLDDIVISRDGTHAAYGSNESGRDEVYIRTFPTPGQHIQVSREGAQYPFWSPDLGVLHYWREERNGRMTFMAAHLRRDRTAVLSRDSLFTGDYLRESSDLRPDGESVIVPQDVGFGQEGPASQASHFLVVINWLEELNRLVPVD